MNLRATLSLVLVMAGGTVNAEIPMPADTARAQAYVDLSGTLFKARDFAGALDALQRAAPLLVGDPSLGVARFNMARCLEELGRPADAATAYDRYLELPDDARRQARAREALARLTSTNVATVVVACRQENSSVRLGDSDLRQCPTEFRLAGGPAILRASADDFEPREYDVVAVVGSRTDVLVDLVTVSKPAATGPGPKTTAGPADRPKPVEGGDDAKPLTADPPPSSVLAVTLIGVAAASIGVGIVFHALAADKRDDAGLEQYGSKRDSLTSDFEMRRAVSFSAYGVGLLLGGVGVYLLLRPADEPRQTLGFRGDGFRVSW